MLTIQNTYTKQFPVCTSLSSQFKINERMPRVMWSNRLSVVRFRRYLCVLIGSDAE